MSFHSPAAQSFIGSVPLAPTRQLPPTTPSLKRPSMDVQKAEIEKRARQRVLLTPPRSDGHAPSDDLQVAFKIPALPGRMRLMTPSSSTVAASSSPPRMSSPEPRSVLSSTSKSRTKVRSGSVKSTMEEAIEVIIERGVTYVFGRHRHHDAHTSSTATLSDNISSLLSNSCAPTKTIFLPRSAIQSSRLHAVVEYLDSSDKLRIIVVGQNGIKVKSGKMKRRMKKGETSDIERENTVKLSFYKCKAILRLPAPIHDEASDEEPREMSAYQSSPTRETLSSLPPSSPPAAFSPYPEEEDEEDEDDVEERNIGDRSSSPLSSMSEDLEDLFSHHVKAEALEQYVAPSPIAESRPIEQRPVSRAPTPVKEEKIIPPLPSDVDLPALIASTVVFSGSSKLSLPDLVKHMLESQPNFRTTAPEDIWNAWVGREVESNPMFGKVSRVGKDSSGHPLLPHYFYSPDHDPDAVRAQELGGLVRPLRNVQRAGGKAIDWRPVGSGRRRY